MLAVQGSPVILSLPQALTQADQTMPSLFDCSWRGHNNRVERLGLRRAAALRAVAAESPPRSLEVDEASAWPVLSVFGEGRTNILDGPGRREAARSRLRFADNCKR